MKKYVILAVFTAFLLSLSSAQDPGFGEISGSVLDVEMHYPSTGDKHLRSFSLTDDEPSTYGEFSSSTCGVHMNAHKSVLSDRQATLNYEPGAVIEDHMGFPETDDKSLETAAARKDGESLYSDFTEGDGFSERMNVPRIESMSMVYNAGEPGLANDATPKLVDDGELICSTSNNEAKWSLCSDSTSGDEVNDGENVYSCSNIQGWVATSQSVGEYEVDEINTYFPNSLNVEESKSFSATFRGNDVQDSSLNIEYRTDDNWESIEDLTDSKDESCTDSRNEQTTASCQVSVDLDYFDLPNSNMDLRASATMGEKSERSDPENVRREDDLEAEWITVPERVYSEEDNRDEFKFIAEFRSEDIDLREAENKIQRSYGDSYTDLITVSGHCDRDRCEVEDDVYTRYGEDMMNVRVRLLADGNVLTEMERKYEITDVSDDYFVTAGNFEEYSDREWAALASISPDYVVPPGEDKLPLSKEEAIINIRANSENSIGDGFFERSEDQLDRLADLEDRRLESGLEGVEGPGGSYQAADGNYIVVDNTASPFSSDGCYSETDFAPVSYRDTYNGGENHGAPASWRSGVWDPDPYDCPSWMSRVNWDLLPSGTSDNGDEREEVIGDMLELGSEDGFEFRDVEWTDYCLDNSESLDVTAEDAGELEGDKESMTNCIDYCAVSTVDTESQYDSDIRCGDLINSFCAPVTEIKNEIGEEDRSIEMCRGD